MVKSRSRPQLSAALLVLALVAPSAWAQDSAQSGRLYDELARMDRELFDAAFVSCDQAKFSSLFTDDAEFYHDRTGATYGERVKQLQSCPRDNGVRRTLVAGSLKVYPIKDFGAVQLGSHTFTREGEPGVEIAQFVHLWRYSEGEWRLARILSFDHRPMTDQAGNSASDTQHRSSVMPNNAISGRRASARRLQGQRAGPKVLAQQAARRLRAAADRGR